MLVYNDIIEIVVAIVTTDVLKDIHILVRKQPYVALFPPSPTIQSYVYDKLGFIQY
jgi:hypothetical protein